MASNFDKLIDAVERAHEKAWAEEFFGDRASLEDAWISTHDEPESQCS